MVFCERYLNDIDSLKQQLMSSFTIKDLGAIDRVIGWKVSRNRKTRSLMISQSNYINDKIRSFGLSDAKPTNTSAEGYDGFLPSN